MELAEPMKLYYNIHNYDIISVTWETLTTYQVRRIGDKTRNYLETVSNAP